MVASKSSQGEKAQSSYVARGQAQVICDLYVKMFLRAAWILLGIEIY